MRRKVLEMQQLLQERRNKLKVTEKVIEKKGNVVDKVTKILHSKERRANYVERKRVETEMFAPTFRVRERSENQAENKEEDDKPNPDPNPKDDQQQNPWRESKFFYARD